MVACPRWLTDMTKNSISINAIGKEMVFQRKIFSIRIVTSPRLNSSQIESTRVNPTRLGRGNKIPSFALTSENANCVKDRKISKSIQSSTGIDGKRKKQKEKKTTKQPNDVFASDHNEIARAGTHQREKNSIFRYLLYHLEMKWNDDAKPIHGMTWIRR